MRPSTGRGCCGSTRSKRCSTPPNTGAPAPAARRVPCHHYQRRRSGRTCCRRRCARWRETGAIDPGVDGRPRPVPAGDLVARQPGGPDRRVTGAALPGRRAHTPCRARSRFSPVRSCADGAGAGRRHRGRVPAAGGACTKTGIGLLAGRTHGSGRPGLLVRGGHCLLQHARARCGGLAATGHACAQSARPAADSARLVGRIHAAARARANADRYGTSRRPRMAG